MTNIVNIQNLERKNQSSSWVNEENSESEVLLEKENYEGIPHMFDCMDDKFLGAFLLAYNNHGDIMISPDDIWLRIMLFFTEYVEKNSDQLRSKFVPHEGKMDLTIVEFAESKEESLLMEKNWDEFFKQIIIKIDNNTNNNIVSKLRSDFSTSSIFEQLISTSMIMSTMKNYFSYGRCICLCGINNVHMKGTLDDWEHLYEKIDSLFEYDIDGKLFKYIEYVKIILEQFVETFKNNVDVNFWNNIFSLEKQRVGSGNDVNIYLEGWMLYFYGLYERTIIDNIKNHTTKVDIKLVNEFTNETKNLTMISGFTGIVRFDDFVYAPKTSIKIINMESNENLSVNHGKYDNHGEFDMLDGSDGSDY